MSAIIQMLHKFRLYSTQSLLKSSSNLSSNKCRFWTRSQSFRYRSNEPKNIKSLLRVNNLQSSYRSKSDESRKELPVFSWKTFIISGGIVTIFGLAFLHFKKEKMILLEKERRRSIGKASIGGNFDLIDQNGKRMQSKDLFGKWVLLYFGFTHCPDICPDEIEKMVKAVDIIESSQAVAQIQPIFITVDPERDSTEAIKGYLKEFSDKIIGLTGTKDQIEAATHAFRVYYSAGPRDHENDYIVDHTIIMYLINPEGEFVDYYGQTKTAEDIASGIALNMVKYNNLKKKFALF